MHQRQAGFTLIEILVVLALMAVMASIAVISVRNHDTQSLVDDFVTRLADVTEIAQEETLFRQRSLGLYLYSGGYLFMAKDDQGWYAEVDRMYVSRQIPEWFDVSLYVDGQPVVLERELPDEPVPQILFVSDLEPTPFEMLVSTEETLQRKLERTPTGRILTDVGASQ